MLRVKQNLWITNLLKSKEETPNTCVLIGRYEVDPIFKCKVMKTICIKNQKKGVQRSFNFGGQTRPTKLRTKGHCEHIQKNSTHTCEDKHFLLACSVWKIFSSSLAKNVTKSSEWSQDNANHDTPSRKKMLNFMNERTNTQNTSQIGPFGHWYSMAWTELTVENSKSCTKV